MKRKHKHWYSRRAKRRAWRYKHLDRWWAYSIESVSWRDEEYTLNNPPMFQGIPLLYERNLERAP